MTNLDSITLLLLPLLTASLVSVVRKGVPAINGKLAVFICATFMGIGLALAAWAVLPYVQPDAPRVAWWGVVVLGATQAAAVYGVASWPRWARDVLTEMLQNVQVQASAPLSFEVDTENLAIPPPPLVPRADPMAPRPASKEPRP